jgi:pilus assembly protein FimV
MLHPVTYRPLVLAVCGCLLACEASALTLGRPRGAALIGRPLELVVPASLEGTESGEPCVAGELFYGDQQVSRPLVRWEPATGRQGVLRITSSQLVDEPAVTLVLTVGCGQSITRRYVVLADVPPSTESAPVVPRAQVASPAAVPVPGAGESAPAVTTAPRAAVPPASIRARREAAAAARGPAEPAVAVRPLRALPAPEQARPAVRAKVPAAERGAVHPRLKLDPLDLGAGVDPVLRLSSDLTLPSGALDPQARQNAAALWEALRRTPDEILQDAVRLQGVQRDLQSLRIESQQNAVAVAQMREQVEKSGNDRNLYSLLVVGLLALLAAVAAGLAWRWQQGRRATARWFEAHSDDSSVGPLSGATPAGQGPVPSPVAGVAAAAAALKSSAPAAAQTALARKAAAREASAGASAANSGFSPSQGGEFQASVGGTVRMVGVEELIDVHDKADFFLSLGQHEQAIAVLESHIHDQVETSALAWMDLLELYHKVDKRADYERLRNEFRQRFTAQVPDFEHFDQPTSSLENYGRALSRIVALWPSRRVLSVIEESIFRKPGLPGAEPFSLEAYRELVLLYLIAKDVAPDEDSRAGELDGRHTDFPSTRLQPLSALDTRDPMAAAVVPVAAIAAAAGAAAAATPPAHLVTQPIPVPVDSASPDFDPDATLVIHPALQLSDQDREMLLIPPASPRVGLDIDLDEPTAEEALALARAAGDSDHVDLDALESDSASLDLLSSDNVDLDALESANADLEEPAPSRRDLPPLDFDTSLFDGPPLTEDPWPKNGA